MKQTTTTINCDVCKADLSTRFNIEMYNKNSVKLLVIFTTEQTEGRNCKNYLSMIDIDLCEECLGRVLKGNYIFAHGAQGHNTYYFGDE